ncbi:MAG TPA: hypothetical protein PKL08_14365, partial [Thermoanaerobaculaceae bacterium]|nr:hypothetical protein [Thermoanaerobaculaceae bacterium]
MGQARLEVAVLSMPGGCAAAVMAEPIPNVTRSPVTLQAPSRTAAAGAAEPTGQTDRLGEVPGPGIRGTKAGVFRPRRRETPGGRHGNTVDLPGKKNPVRIRQLMARLIPSALL